jgi:hypothetical protein
MDVWRERSIFDKEVMQDLEHRLAGEYLPYLTFSPPLSF